MISCNSAQNQFASTAEANHTPIVQASFSRAVSMPYEVPNMTTDVDRSRRRSMDKDGKERSRCAIVAAFRVLTVRVPRRVAGRQLDLRAVALSHMRCKQV